MKSEVDFCYIKFPTKVFLFHFIASIYREWKIIDLDFPTKQILLSLIVILSLDGEI